MHWAQQRPYRTLFGIASFLPAFCIVALAIWSVGDPVVDRLLSFDFDMFKHGPRAIVIRFCVMLGIAVALQMGLGAAVALHMEKRPELSNGNKVMWIIGCFFVGSIFLPLFYFRKLRRWTGGTS
jgi:hypothetical protein